VSRRRRVVVPRGDQRVGASRSAAGEDARGLVLAAGGNHGATGGLRRGRARRSASARGGRKSAAREQSSRVRARRRGQAWRPAVRVVATVGGGRVRSQSAGLALAEERRGEKLHLRRGLARVMPRPRGCPVA